MRYIEIVGIFYDDLATKMNYMTNYDSIYALNKMDVLQYFAPNIDIFSTHENVIFEEFNLTGIYLTIYSLHGSWHSTSY